MLERLKLLTLKRTRRLSARLEGVAGFTGGGDFRYALSPAGSANYEAQVKGVAGLRCELFVQGEYIATVPCDHGRATAKFDSRLGDPAIRLQPGDTVEIRQNGDVILAGDLGA